MRSMNVASLPMCKELYKLSGWERADLWVVDQDSNEGAYRYDLGYLLQKLPAYLQGNLVLERDGLKNGWCAYYDAMPVTLKSYHNDTPEDAASKLAIELFKQGVLTPKNKET